jgi:hypothetical protein
MPTKTKRIIGWTLTILVGLFLIGVSGVPKFFDFPGKADLMSKLQIPLNLVTTLGVIEVSVAVLYLIPRTAFLGAILATGHLGGAEWTHLRVGDPWSFPIIIGVLMWTGLALRRPVIFRLLQWRHPSTTPRSVKPLFVDVTDARNARFHSRHVANCLRVVGDTLSGLMAICIDPRPRPGFRKTVRNSRRTSSWGCRSD